jgi:hypothetical protein
VWLIYPQAHDGAILLSTNSFIFVERVTTTHISPFASLKEVLDVTLFLTMDAMSSKVKVRDFGPLTTPQLHFMVLYDNENQTKSKDETPYLEQLSSAYAIVLSGDEKEIQISKRKRVVDCAYGVGGNCSQKICTAHTHMMEWLISPVLII